MEPKKKRILFGCLGGCGLMLLLGVGSCVGFSVWLKSPGKLLEPARLRGPDTDGYVEWTLRLEDPGTGQFVSDLLGRLDELNRNVDSPLPDELESFLDTRRAAATRRDIERLFPIVVAWTLRAEKDGDRHLGSISARGIGHQMMLMDWILGFIFGRADDVTTVRHRGEKIFLFDDTAWRPAVFIHDGIVFAASDVESARRALDLVDLRGDLSANARDGNLEALIEQVPADRSLRGAWTNENGELLRLLDALGVSRELDAADWNELRGATIAAGFTAGERFEGRIELLAPNGVWASERGAQLGAAVSATLESSKLAFRAESRVAGDRVVVEFSVENLLDGLMEWIRTLDSDDAVEAASPS